jgi:hypothetical protein
MRVSDPRVIPPSNGSAVTGVSIMLRDFSDVSDN